MTERQASTTTETSTGELLSRLSDQTSRLVRGEIQLAQAELTGKLKHVGLGAGMFGAAGLVAFFGLATLVTTAILALALALPAWLSALIVMVVLFAVAGVLALVGRGQVRRGRPPVPERTVDSVHQDVQMLKREPTP
ncbi:conserved hypothetical protein [metagenome]|uniref:Integral membrane protein n=1 Tax=metagenome TaxID=256318 RepID=A0A2P2C9W2_9ZZZZ